MPEADRIKHFVQTLAERAHSEGVFNPYQSVALANNLRRYLERMFARGGRRGVPCQRSLVMTNSAETKMSDRATSTTTIADDVPMSPKMSPRL